MQELCELLIDEDADVRAAIKSCVIQQPFKLICHRLLHHLDDNSLLDFLNNILGQSYSQRSLQQLASTDVPLPGSPVGRALWVSQRLEQCLQLLVFGCVAWQELDSLSLHIALAFHHPQLQRAFQASDQHQVTFWVAAAVNVMFPCLGMPTVSSPFAGCAPWVLMQLAWQLGTLPDSSLHFDKSPDARCFYAGLVQTRKPAM